MLVPTIFCVWNELDSTTFITSCSNRSIFSHIISLLCFALYYVDYPFVQLHRGDSILISMSTHPGMSFNKRLTFRVYMTRHELSPLLICILHNLLNLHMLLFWIIYQVPTINQIDHSSDWLNSLKRNFNFNTRPRQNPL